MSQIDFELERLGWKAFEDLVSCVLSTVLGQTFQVFAEGPDGGRDGAFKGTWAKEGSETFAGSFVAQCKHTSSDKTKLSKSAVAAECRKITRLAKAGLCDTYLFFTNHSVSGERVAELETAFRKAGAKHASVYGRSWINSKICENPTLRRLVPRIYGLGDLSQIISHQAYAQARAVLDGLMPDLHCFVPTGAYRKSAHALKEHGFVMLVGEPASGKTMIANLLALSAADEWDLQTLMLSSPEDLDALWNPNDPGQFLWVDDAFGATQYDLGRVLEWNQRLPKLKAAIRLGARVVFTSRDYIFNAAKLHLKTSAFELFDDSRVTIEVEALTKVERQSILYNHLKYGSQKKEFLKKVVPYLDEVVEVPRFLPEVARRFAVPKFTEGTSLASDGIVRFFSKPMEVIERVITNMGAAEQAALALIFIHGGRLPIPLPPNEKVNQTIDMLGSSIGAVKSALVALDGSFVARVEDENGSQWRFRHPTVGDAFGTVTATNPELVEVYLSGVSTERLMQEVTCGDVGLKGVRIVIPSPKYGDVVERLAAYRKGAAPRFYNDPVTTFLSTRCSKTFLKMWFAKHGSTSQTAKSIAFVARFDDSIKLLLALKTFGLLDEQARLDAVSRISQISSNSSTVNFMKEDVVGDLLYDEEKDQLFTSIAEQTLANIDGTIFDTRQGWDGDSEPSYEFDDVSTTLRLIAEKGSEEDSERAISALTSIDRMVDEMNKEREEAASYDSLQTEKAKSAPTPVTNRSIFDDLVD